MEIDRETILWCLDERKFPVQCVRCSYLLRGLGNEGRCPECGAPFVRYERLAQLYPGEMTRFEVGVDTAFDLSCVDKIRFLVSCEYCEGPLDLSAERGECASCGARYLSHLRLWEVHGPEAFTILSTDEEDRFRASAAIATSALTCLLVLMIAYFWWIVGEDPSMAGVVLKTVATIVIAGIVGRKLRVRHT